MPTTEQEKAVLGAATNGGCPYAFVLIFLALIVIAPTRRLAARIAHHLAALVIYWLFLMVIKFFAPPLVLLTKEEFTELKKKKYEYIEVDNPELSKKYSQLVTEHRKLEKELKTSKMDLLKLAKELSKAQDSKPAVQHTLAFMPVLRSELTEVRVIGEGTSGIVREVKWKGKSFAWKSFKKTVVEDPEMFTEVFKEAQSGLVVRSPFIVQAVGVTDVPGILTELMNKGSLHDVLFKQKVKLTLSQKHRIALNVARGILAFHKNKLIHCDIKPGNVLVHQKDGSAELIAKIGDFGTLKVLRMSISRTDSYTGTYAFMAPEVLESILDHFRRVATDPYAAQPVNEEMRPKYARPTAKSDVFSFAVLLFELITERQAFQGLFFDSVAIFMGHIVKGGRPVIPPECPEHWRDLINKCWYYEPGNRPSMEEVVKTLEGKEFSGASNSMLDPM